jgi:hypothetical protein
MNYEEVLRISAAAVDALGKPLRGIEKAFVILLGTAKARQSLRWDVGHGAAVGQAQPCSASNALYNGEA